MADKTVNINIKYNVDTSQVIRAQAQSAAAQAATERLRKSVEEYGKAGAQANKVIQDSLKKTSTDINTLAKDFNGLYSSIKTVLAAGIVREFIDLSLNAARLSGQIDGVTQAFSRLPNSTLLLNDLRKATHGTVTDLQLMQRALSASNFRIPLEKLGTLLEFAAVKAQQTGQEVNHLVDYIVSGIGYRSIKRLDDLGFTANRVKEALGGVSIQAASMGQLMTAVTNLMNEDLQKTGGYAETAATQVGKLETAWHELSVEVSKQATSGGFIKFLTESVEAMRVFAAAGFSLRDVPVVVVAESIEKMAVAQAEAFQKANSALAENERILDADKKIADLAETIKLYKDQGLAGEQSISVLKEEIKALEDKNKSIIGLQRLGTEESNQIGIKKQRIDQITKENEALKMNSAVVAETIRILVDYSSALRQVTKDEEAEIELRDKILGRDTLSEKKRPAKDPFVQRVVDNQQLVDVQKQLQDALDRLGLIVTIPVKPAVVPYEDSELQQALERNKNQIVDASFDIASEQLTAVYDAEVDAYSQRIKALRDFYDEQQTLAGDNDKAKEQLRIKEDREIKKLEKEKADREKRAALAGILINTALGVTKAFATAVTVYDGLIQAAIVAAQGASQYAVASKARYYNKGEINIKGPGTETSDSIPAMLSKGESIMTAKQTREAFGILNDVRAGRLNDKVLRQLVSNGGSQLVMDDSRIVNAIKGQPRPPDLVRQGREIYEVYSSKEGHKRFIRSKSMG